MADRDARHTMMMSDEDAHDDEPASFRTDPATLGLNEEQLEAFTAMQRDCRAEVKKLKVRHGAIYKSLVEDRNARDQMLIRTSVRLQALENQQQLLSARVDRGEQKERLRGARRFLPWREAAQGRTRLLLGCSDSPERDSLAQCRRKKVVERTISSELSGSEQLEYWRTKKLRPQRAE